MKKVLIIMILTIVSIAPILAIPYTTLGNIKVPDAYVLPSKMVELSYVSYMSPADQDSVYTHSLAGVMNFGIMDWVEVGLVFTNQDIYFANAKVRFIRESEIFPSIAIGADNLFSPIKDFKDSEIEFDDIDDYNEVTDLDDYVKNSVYVVITKSTVMRGLPFMPYLDTKMHIGFGQKRFVGNTPLSKQLTGMFMGLEFRPIANLAIITEMDGYNINTGLQYSFQNFNINVGTYRLEELDRRKLKFAINLKYTFDMLADTKLQDSRNKSGYKQVMGSGRRVMSSSDFSTGDSLDSEIENLKSRREETEKELEKIRKLLEE